jgi:hypothetical protein
LSVLASPEKPILPEYRTTSNVKAPQDQVAKPHSRTNLGLKVLQDRISGVSHKIILNVLFFPQLANRSAKSIALLSQVKIRKLSGHPITKAVAWSGRDLEMKISIEITKLLAFAKCNLLA